MTESQRKCRHDVGVRQSQGVKVWLEGEDYIEREGQWDRQGLRQEGEKGKEPG